MRKLVAICLALIWCVLPVLADSIITRGADIIECKVTQVGDNSVKYCKTGEKFDREISRGDVFKIKYDNGEEELIPAAAAAPQSQSRPQGYGGSPYAPYRNTETEPDWSAFPPASRQYKTGDWYSENGVEGIVIWTTPDGRHGRIINKRKFTRPYAFFSGPLNVPLGMTDKSNGYANMKALDGFMRANPGFGPDMFAVAQVLWKLGPGWYLPSINELDYFFRLRDTEVAYTGENEKFNGKTVKWHKIIDNTSKAHGGDKLNNDYVLSSTEIYSPGGASASYEALFGDPHLPQFALLKMQMTKNDRIKPIVRHKGLPFYAFHLF